MPATPTDSEASFVLVPEGSKSSSDAEKKTSSIHRSDGIPAIALESKVSKYLSAPTTAKARFYLLIRRRIPPAIHLTSLVVREHSRMIGHTKQLEDSCGYLAGILLTLTAAFAI